MGKIQDAIRKLQSGARDAAQGSAIEADDVLAQSDAHEAGTHSAFTDTEIGVEKSEFTYGGPSLALHRDHLISAGLLDPDQQRKQMTAEYRQIVRSILRNVANLTANGGLRGNTIAVTSTEVGEGSSFLALNLALALAADPGCTVVLVDADVARPDLTKALKASHASGLSDVVRGDVPDPNQIIMPTDTARFAFLPVGMHCDAIDKSVEGSPLAPAIDQLAVASRRRLFVFDIGAFGAERAASRLASFCGQLLLVVESGRTPQKTALDALDHLRSNDTSQAIGIVFNKVVA